MGRGLPVKNEGNDGADNRNYSNADESHQTASL
jgi:hypothetical protein